MNINDVEKRTGLEASTIRYYEEKGLIQVARNPENNYREYTQKNVESLRVIRFLRKLDFTLDEIKRVVVDGEAFGPIIDSKIDALKEASERIEKSLMLLTHLKDTGVTGDTIDTSSISNRVYLFRTKKTWIDWVNDLSDKVCKITRIPRTAFIPEDLIFTKEDFTVELIAYAYREGRDLEILREGLEPLVKINGKTYQAMRAFGSRYGAAYHYVVVMPV